MNQFGALVAIDPGTKLADAVVSFSGARSRLSGGAAERTQLSSWLISWRPLPCFTFQAFSAWQLTDWTKRHSLRGYFCRYFRLLHCPTVLIRTVNQWRGGTRVIHELLIDDTSPQIDLLGAMQGLCSEDATGSRSRRSGYA